MLRFIACLGESAAAAQRLIQRCQEALPEWQKVLRLDGLHVFCTSSDAAREIRILPGGRGVVLGRLFRDDAPCDPEFDESEADRLLATRGRELVRTYWGNYVAFLHREATSETWVLRGPASGLPCLHTRIEGVEVYCSWMEACARAWDACFDVDWRYVARSLLGPTSGSTTGLVGVEELPPGNAEHISSNGRVRYVYWSPRKVPHDDELDVESAATDLLDTTCACVRAWSSGRRRVLHALSGGLDSSIVLSGLRAANPSVEAVCVNHYTQSPEGDERQFARLAAAHAGCALIEHERNAAVDLRLALNPVRFESSLGLHIPEVERIDTDIARDLDADVIFRGHGGDELFCRHHGVLYVSDLLRRRGLRSPLLSLALDCAVSEGDSIWSVLGTALHYAVFPQRWNPARTFLRDQEDHSLLRREVLCDLVREEEMAISPHSSWPAGKRWQASLVTARRPYYSPFQLEDDPETVSPLLSQPLIELCLRIPTWLQMMGRRDRHVARQAFAGHLPQEILQRRDKGGAEDLGWKIFTRNLPFIRELLLDGQVMRSGIIDRARLEDSLSLAWGGPTRATVPVFALLGVEIWLRAWSTH